MKPTTLPVKSSLAQIPDYATLAPAIIGGSPMDALYVHVPFCSTKCHYCDFYSLADHLEEADDFLDALEVEIALHLKVFSKPRPRTVFIGGGTPTLLSPAQLERLLRLLGERFDLSQVVEFTVEANPNTFDGTRARVLAAGGVNRISFGAQSFNRDELLTLQRDHDPASVPAAFETAREAGIGNLNVDLIFGIPGQTLASWEFSLGQALALAPAHISCYSLTYEANTPMTARMHRGDFQKIDEALELEMFQYVFGRLRDGGFVRYEISNFAYCGAGILPARIPEGQTQICQHNLAYWKARNWLGLGPSAGSHVASASLPMLAQDARDLADGSQHGGPAAYQWKNAGSLTHYVEALRGAAPRLPITQLEKLPRNKWVAAAAVFWLRLAEGLNFQEFQARTCFDAEPALRNILRPFCETGFAEIGGMTARITEAGVPVSNHILSRVLAGMEGVRVY